jgi:hypothetical protein
MPDLLIIRKHVSTQINVNQINSFYLLQENINFVKNLIKFLRYSSQVALKQLKNSTKN